MSKEAVCSVRSAGPGEEGRVNIQLIEQPGTNHFGGNWLWFAADATRKKEMLATALAAMSNSMHVWVSLDNVNPNVPSGDIAGNIISIYLTTG